MTRWSSWPRRIEVPENERAPVIQAYLLRAGRRAGSKAVTNEARCYFGLSADPSLQEIGRITKHYPVFRIVELSGIRRRSTGSVGSGGWHPPPSRIARQRGAWHFAGWRAASDEFRGRQASCCPCRHPGWIPS